MNVTSPYRLGLLKSHIRCSNVQCRFNDSTGQTGNQGILVITWCRTFCLPGCYSKI